MAMANSYWNNNGKYQAEYSAISEKLIPSMGNCPTLEGEYLRAVSRIYHDLYNNGFGNNWSGAWNFLNDNAVELKLDKEDLQALHYYRCGTCYSGRFVDDNPVCLAIENIANKVMEFIIAKNGQYVENTENVDLFDFSEPDDYPDEDEEDEDY